MATVSIEMDKKLMEDFTKLCDDLGLSVNTAFNVFAKKAVRKKRMPFKVQGYDENGFITEAELLRRIEDAEAGRNLERHDLDEM